MPKKLKVFLCHSSNDKPAVREIYQRLKSETWIDPWLDEEELYPGQDWDLEIEKAVEKTDTVLVFLSKNSVSKEGYIQRELRMILRMADYKPEGTIFTLPLRLDNCSLPRRLSMNHYVDLFPESRKEWAYKRLLGGLKIRAEKLGIDMGGKLKVDTSTTLSTGSGDVKRKRVVSSEQEKAEKTRKDKRAQEEERIEKRARELALEIARKEREEREEEKARELAKEMARKAREEREKKERAKREKEALVKKRTANPAGIEWIKIPAGEFTMGSNDYGDEKPPHKVYLDEYLIGKTPVTNAQFKKFIDAGGYKKKEYWSNKGWDWISGEKRSQPDYWDNKKWNTPPQPVVGVSWYEAEAFSKWANCRLPSEAEWEKAARGTDGRKYPWGNEKPNKNLANFSQNIGKTTSVGKYSPAGDSPYGCVDMAGNVWEWVSSLYKSYPYDAEDGREDLAIADSRVAVRGTTMKTSSAPPIASGSIQRLRTTTSGSAAPAHPSSEILNSVILKTEAGVWGSPPVAR